MLARPRDGPAVLDLGMPQCTPHGMPPRRRQRRRAHAAGWPTKGSSKRAPPRMCAALLLALAFARLAAAPTLAVDTQRARVCCVADGVRGGVTRPCYGCGRQRLSCRAAAGGSGRTAYFGSLNCKNILWKFVFELRKIFGRP